jgi:hypothetical protein
VGSASRRPGCGALALHELCRWVSGGSLWGREETEIARAVYSWNKSVTPRAAVPELKAGDHVHHAQFGDGVVVSSQPVRDDVEVVVAFDGAGVKKLLMSFARLEKV